MARNYNGAPAELSIPFLLSEHGVFVPLSSFLRLVAIQRLARFHKLELGDHSPIGP